MGHYGKESKSNLKTCNKPIQVLFNKVDEIINHSVLDGLRDKGTQEKAFKNNASKVHWPDSKHNGQAPDYDISDGIDAAPYPMPKGWGAINGTSRREISLDWKERVKFYEFAAIVRYEWAKLQKSNKEFKDYTLTWGGDWDRDGQYIDNTFDDLVHFQITRNDVQVSDATEAWEEHD